MKITATDVTFFPRVQRTKARPSGKAADHVLAWGECASFEGWVGRRRLER